MTVWLINQYSWIMFKFKVHFHLFKLNMYKEEIRNFCKHFEIRVLRRNSPIFFSNERSMVIPTYANLVYVSIVFVFVFVFVFVLFLHLTICWWTLLVPKIDIVIVKKLVRTIYLFSSQVLKTWQVQTVFSPTLHFRFYILISLMSRRIDSNSWLM